MDEDILYLWSLKKSHLILINFVLLMFVILYCFNKITSYNKILPVKKSKKYAFLMFIIFGGIYVLISYMFLLPIVVYPFSVVMSCFLTKLSYEISWKNALFFSNDFTLIPLLSNYIVTNSIAVITNVPVQDTSDYWVSVEAIIGFFLAFVISYYINFKRIEKKHWFNFINNNQYCKTLVLIQLYIILTISFSSIAYNYNLTIWFSRIMLFALFCTLITYLTILDYVVRASSISVYEINNKILEEQLRCQIDNYNSQVRYINEIRKFKHDFLPLMNTINVLLEENRIGDVKTILKQTKNISETYFNIHKEFSNNLFIQAILNNAYQESVEKCISFNARVFIPKEVNIKEIDMCRIFLNLKNNAMEACCNSFNKKEINITGNIKDNWFILIFENSFNGMVKKIDEEIFTIKKDSNSHGLGLKIVKETVERYDGFMKVEWDDTMFYIKIYIPY